MVDLPPRQAEALKSGVQYIQRHGYPPTVRELAASMGISAFAARRHLAALDRKGVIRRDPTPRGIAIP